MSEVTFLLRCHPLVTGLLLAGLSPVFVLLLVLFSPLLVTLMFFLLGIAGLARSRRRLGRHRSRRRRYKHHHGGNGSGDEFFPGNDALESEKAMRVNEYLEDQLKNLEAVKPFDSTSSSPLRGVIDDDPMLDPLPTSRPSSWDGLDDDESGLFPQDCGVRSDVSELGDDNSESFGAIAS